MSRTALLLAILALARAAADTDDDENRIVNGVMVPHGKHPFMVSLKNRGSHRCGGTILNRDWVMTAAHCFEESVEEAKRILTIHSGTTKLNVAGNVHKIINLKIHKEFDKTGRFENDIALLKVSPPFPKGGYEAAVNLPKAQHRVTPGSWLSVIGWGLDRAGGQIQNSLMEVDLKILGDEHCEIPPLNHKKICAFYPKGGKGACNGDSGGPLLLAEDKTQVGIVSWGKLNCGGRGSYTVFTEVANYVELINNVINN